MKILIIGGTGVIGFKALKYFSSKDHVDYTYLTHKSNFSEGYSLDITQKEDTIELISRLKPEIVIHTTALTNVDLCETNPQLAYSINVEGTSNIIEGCKKAGSKFVYLSTSAVFDGKKEQYFEHDRPSPSSHYGSTKYQGEQLTIDSGLSYLILRTDQPYCWIEKWQHTNSVVRVVETLRSGKILREIVDWYNTPTYVPDFVVVMDSLLVNGLTGIFHVVGPDFINRYDWSIKVANIFGLDKDRIEPIHSNTLNLPVKRVNVHLNNNKLFQNGIKIIDVNTGLENMREDENNESHKGGYS